MAHNGVNRRMAKHDRERLRDEKKQAKADRLAQRRAEKISGVDIDTLPEDYRGVARTLANGAERRAPDYRPF